MATELELLAKKYAKKKVVVIREDIQKNLNRINQAALPFMRKLSAQAKKSNENLKRFVTYLETLQNEQPELVTFDLLTLKNKLPSYAILSLYLLKYFCKKS